MQIYWLIWVVISTGFEDIVVGGPALCGKEQDPWLVDYFMGGVCEPYTWGRQIAWFLQQPPRHVYFTIGS
jgi:hypothetical protein